MFTAMTFVALLGPAAMAAAGGISLRAPRRRRSGVDTITQAAAGLSLLVAGTLTGFLALEGPTTSPLLGAWGLGVALRLDTLSVLIFSMVALLGIVLVRFSRTYLEGDSRRNAFLGWMCLTLGSVQVLVLSGNLALFIAAWVSTSLSLHRLLLFYGDRPRAVLAARKKFIVARIGDVSLAAASVLLYRQFGTGDIATIMTEATAASAGASLSAATVLLAVAALFKSAQFPTHGWLVEVMETPTPVSALLHAGIINAGPFLVMRFAAVMDTAVLAPLLLVAVGGFTALFASVVLSSQPSVKVALGYSSAAHMGFMLLVCGLGVYPAAVLHLVAHSFYKAHAFLSSGSVVDEARAKLGRSVPRQSSLPRLLLSLVVASAIYFGLAGLLGFSPEENPALLAVGAILVMGLWRLLAPVIDMNRPTLGALVRVAGLAASVGLSFFLLEEGARLLLLDSLPEAQEPSSMVTTVATIVLVTFALAIVLPLRGLTPGGSLRRAAYVHLRNGLYANAAFDRLVGGLHR